MLAVVPLVAWTARGVVTNLVGSSSVIDDIVSALAELTLPCVPLALVLGLVALIRHAGAPERPGLAFAIAGAALSAAELALILRIATADF